MNVYVSIYDWADIQPYMKTMLWILKFRADFSSPRRFQIFLCDVKWLRRGGTKQNESERQCWTEVKQKSSEIRWYDADLLAYQRGGQSQAHSAAPFTASCPGPRSRDDY